MRAKVIDRNRTSNKKLKRRKTTYILATRILDTKGFRSNKYLSQVTA